MVPDSPKKRRSIVVEEEVGEHEQVALSSKKESAR
jgi:hypothetical protein